MSAKSQLIKRLWISIIMGMIGLVLMFPMMSVKFVQLAILLLLTMMVLVGVLWYRISQPSPAHDTDAHQTEHSFALQRLRDYRHEWMNQLQLMVAYSQLKKWPELESFIQTLQERAVQENHLLNTGDAQLSLLLLTELHLYPSLTFDVQCERMTTDSQLKFTDKQPARWLTQQLQQCQRTAAEAGTSSWATSLRLAETSAGFFIELSCKSPQSLVNSEHLSDGTLQVSKLFIISHK